MKVHEPYFNNKQVAILSFVVFAVAAAIFYGAKRTWPKGEW
jgi:hypothetical protein